MPHRVLRYQLDHRTPHSPAQGLFLWLAYQWLIVVIFELINTQNMDSKHPKITKSVSTVEPSIGGACSLITPINGRGVLEGWGVCDRCMCCVLVLSIVSIYQKRFF